jgi:hypothetical protein
MKTQWDVPFFRFELPGVCAVHSQTLDNRSVDDLVGNGDGAIKIEGGDPTGTIFPSSTHAASRRLQIEMDFGSIRARQSEGQRLILNK